MSRTSTRISIVVFLLLVATLAFQTERLEESRSRADRLYGSWELEVDAFSAVSSVNRSCQMQLDELRQLNCDVPMVPRVPTVTLGVPTGGPGPEVTPRGTGRGGGPRGGP